MFVWDRGGAIRRYEVIVQRDLARLSEQLKELFPGESIAAQSNGKTIVLSGTVSSKDVIEKAVNVAAGYVDKKEDVVTAAADSGRREQPGPAARPLRRGQPQRDDRTRRRPSPPNGFKDGRLVRPQRDGTVRRRREWDKDGKLVFSDFLNLFLFDSKKRHRRRRARRCRTKGLFQSLAEPNLVAESGKEASFLAGGEIPIPIAQARRRHDRPSPCSSRSSAFV